MTLPMNIPTSTHVHHTPYSTSLTNSIPTNSSKLLPYDMMLHHPHNIMHAYKNMSSSPVAIHMSRLNLKSGRYCNRLSSHREEDQIMALDDPEDIIRPASPSTARKNTIHPFANPRFSMRSGLSLGQDLAQSPSTVIAPLPRKVSPLEEEQHALLDSQDQSYPLVLTPTFSYLDQDTFSSACQELKSIICSSADECNEADLLNVFGSTQSPFDAVITSSTPMVPRPSASLLSC